MSIYKKFRKLKKTIKISIKQKLLKFGQLLQKFAPHVTTRSALLSYIAGYAAADKKQWEIARDFFVIAAQGSKNPKWHTHLGRAYDYCNQWDLASDSFSTALRLRSCSDSALTYNLFDVTFYEYKNKKYYFRCKKRILAEADLYRITYYSQNSNILFIVFNQITSGMDTKPFGLDYLLSKGYDVVTCHQGSGTQYQSLSYHIFETVVRPYSYRRHVYLYGSSLGGYCALYYASAVNGTAFALSPRNSMHPIFHTNTTKEKSNPCKIST